MLGGGNDQAAPDLGHDRRGEGGIGLLAGAGDLAAEGAFALLATSGKEPLHIRFTKALSGTQTAAPGEAHVVGTAVAAGAGEFGAADAEAEEVGSPQLN